MNRKVFWSRSAEKSLEDILDYIIEHDGKSMAFKIYNKIKKQSTLLKVSPFQGREVKEMKSLKKKYKEIIVSPWRIIYTIEKNIVHVLLVIDARRDLDEILYEMIINIDDYSTT